jgi:hypothetical protein
MSDEFHPFSTGGDMTVHTKAPEAPEEPPPPPPRAPEREQEIRKLAESTRRELRTWGVDESKVRYDYEMGDVWLVCHLLDAWDAALTELASLRARLQVVEAEQVKGERVFQAVVYAFEGHEVPEDLREHGMVRRGRKHREAAEATLSRVREFLNEVRQHDSSMSRRAEADALWREVTALDAGQPGRDGGTK